MKIPFTSYELAHVRKALSAGVLALGAAVVTALTNHVAASTLITWPAVGGLAGAFLVAAVGTFWTPANKSLIAEIATVIEDVDPALVPILDPILATTPPTMTVTSSASSSTGSGLNQ
jgi:hypothetical protein